MTLNVTSTNNTAEYKAAVLARLGPIIAKWAMAIQADSAATAPVDTGALKNSMEASEAGELKWQIQDGVEYGVFQELGTSRGIQAKNFLGGACEKNAQGFYDEVAGAMR